jgi:hypothetical protein
LQDTLITKLTYFEQREDYKVISIDGKLVDTPYEKLGGAISSGEFGTMLKEIFEPQTQTEFVWTRWSAGADWRMSVAAVEGVTGQTKPQQSNKI